MTTQALTETPATDEPETVRPPLGQATPEPHLRISPVPGALPLGDTATARHHRSRPVHLWSPETDRVPSPDTTQQARRQVALQEARHVRSLARIVALACVEAELGLRPARQLSAWLNLPTYEKMVRRTELAQRIRPPHGRAIAPQALGARACATGDGAYEASATVQLPDRSRAMALRLERHRSGWKVTALELG